MKKVGPLEYQGHIPATRAVALLGGHVPRFAMSVRDPLERFVSCLNYFYGTAETTPEAVWKRLQANLKMDPPRLWARPQAWFILGHDVELFPFEDLPVLRWIGYGGEIPQHNVAHTHYWTLERIEPIIDRVKAYYADDFALREQALSSFN